MNAGRITRRAAPFVQRLLAAVLGGYLLASAWVVFCGALSTPKAEAVLVGMQFSFAIHVAAAIWAFSPVALSRMWLGIVVPSAMLAVAAFVLMHWRG
ncbi:hypothetical protein G7047_10100 [Diaphorobacter sp. HDW4A]|uniref:hypothetical protein n=1 Tax=Diaphorobacter sp. HDW4A TaxID=2714924 RepID=UPI0014099C2C|nr:hypothetical protein [Diaphorobacter sp. HDW4A]QIL80212.1 hypothetical protein G7047_10100 [Diaphorobacter sp. HDW4A]